MPLLKAKFYEVTVDYLLGRSETKNHPNADLADLRLSDDMIELLKSGRVDNSLLCELAAHPDFPRLMADLIIRPNIIVGDYTYYDDIDGAENFESHVTHHYEFLGDKLIIGKFCAIARGIEFIMNGANHRMNSVTTYPFNIMGGGWEKFTPDRGDLPFKGDTVVGNDVWIGQNVTVLPGVHIGDGAVIGADSVVTKNIPPYTVAGGNPCSVIRKRFDDELTAYLLRLKWWDWDADKIFRNMEALCSGDLRRIKEVK